MEWNYISGNTGKERRFLDKSPSGDLVHIEKLHSGYMSNDIKPGALNQRLFDWHIKTVP